MQKYNKQEHDTTEARAQEPVLVSERWTALPKALHQNPSKFRELLWSGAVLVFEFLWYVLHRHCGHF